MYGVCNKIGEFVQWCKSPSEEIHTSLPITEKIKRVGKNVLDATAPHGTFQRYAASNLLPYAVKYIGVPTALLIGLYHAAPPIGHTLSVRNEPWHLDEESWQHTIHDLTIGAPAAISAAVLSALIAKDLLDKGKQAFPDVLQKVVIAAASTGFLHITWSAGELMLSLIKHPQSHSHSHNIEEECLILRAILGNFIGGIFDTLAAMGIGLTALGLHEIYNYLKEAYIHYQAKANEHYATWKEHEKELVALEEGKEI